MAESSREDVELRPQSVGVNPPSDAPATTTNEYTFEDGEDVGEIKVNSLATDKQSAKIDEQSFEDGSARSDTETSRAGSVAGDARSDFKAVKKPTLSKPVSFAKYSVPKVMAATTAPKAVIEKAPAAPSIVSTTQPVSRFRLVAKPTGTGAQKVLPFKPTAPDPMQVWNKNRVTPQASTKHLTDEELKKQYDIHLTPRIQSDGDGKEAKWADIDDDEDDWVPETIEWNDGTKTTVNQADAPATKQSEDAKIVIADASKSGVNASKPSKQPFTSTLGPNATVLKLGGSLERQQAQRAAAQQLKGQMERLSSSGPQAMPAPAPAKSPWAKIPEVEKVSPVPMSPPPLVAPAATKFPALGVQPPSQMPGAPSPTKEISADDFNRSWRNSPSSQTRELFMPSSGRYETVPEGRRRMSRNEQNFRAPAVLQRPGATDPKAPAEPSAAFQTHRTSIDQGRRRASSSISGGSGQLVRRMSFKSNDVSVVMSDGRRASIADNAIAHLQTPDGQQQPAPAPAPPSSLPAPTTYQARGGEPLASGPPNLPDVDIEAQRTAQKAAMKENIERARKRKQEEEQRLEAEKQERIRVKLASLGPPPEKPKLANERSPEDLSPESAAQMQIAQSPPKPPQPLPTGEPQQYGMMKVHPMDSVRKLGPPASQQTDQMKPAGEMQATATPAAQSPDDIPTINGVHHGQEPPSAFSDDDANPEPSPKFSRPVAPVVSDARAGWGRNDHRAPQSGSLWGLPSNKSLGNGTFDQSLAGYSPQDLSRTSSTGQPWMNGRTPTMGQSPQLHQANHGLPETRSHLLQSMTSPGQQPLSLNSEVDSALPTSRPVPIGPPQPGAVQQNALSQNANSSNNQVAAWNNFHNVARVNEKAETERFQREMHERREEEKRTGTRQQAAYNFSETFKQVQLGDQVGQRHISHVTQGSHPPNHLFSTVGSSQLNEVPGRMANGQTMRGSRFFPPATNGLTHERRSVTYSHPEIPRTPSPPPAEEAASYHPAFDGGHYVKPVVHFPPTKPIVRLPPPPPPPAPVAPMAPSKEIALPQSKTPMTWAARVSMSTPVVVPVTASRAVSAPIAQIPSWQERFNGLLGKKESATRPGEHLERPLQPAPAISMTKEPLDVTTIVSASVSLPAPSEDLFDTGKTTSKDVEDEEDLFEDREAGSLPIIHFPRDSPANVQARVSIPRSMHAPVDPITAHMFMVNNWSERHGHQKPQYAIIRAPGTNGKGIRKDLPSRSAESTPQPKPRTGPGYFGQKSSRSKTGFKPRPTAKAH